MPRTDRSRRRLLRAALAAPAVVALPALAQGFPARPIRLICPWPAGGSTDAVMRSLAESAGKALGGQVVVENKAGASGMLGPNELVTAKPDGYTLSQLTIGIARLPHMQKMQFDPLKDFTYVACLTGYTFGLVVRADSPVKSVQELVDWCKANPGKFTFGSPGNGTTPHLAVEEFAFKAGIKMQHVPFKGVAEGMQALLGGHIMSHSDSTGWASHVDAGTMRLLATYGSKRTRRWPNVPTLHELGFETLADSPFGIGGPRGMDPAVTRRLHDGFRRTLEDPAVLATFEKYDQSVIYMGSADYEKYIREQYVKEKEIIEKLGLAMKA
ncbi:tripartite tricarboxylate transporter substrate binding protein [Ramlibacter monticola]|uniref:Tripartite tricarboxylate transporter substrate binding protein n=1 Tax=Ramlibacter monticola TaxID=1926872 RepID=A0A937CR28_9BURK|nr:tripartite tricarboxylate transporter substrate binding protein [Ramlibacter monticola]MBL0390031.1 tripartite tricarboxylate transporter substrate binding protein [Ramlibacter monticola]